MKLLLIVIELLLLASECVSAEPGKPFVPPVAEPQLSLIVDTPPVSSSAACPMDASVLVQVMDGVSVFGGSGTCVFSKENESIILTCAHTWRGVKNPDVRVIAGKRDLVATIVRQDTETDLAVLKVDAELPAIDLADVLPNVGDTVTSVGASLNWQNLVEKEHRFKKLETDGKPPFLVADGTLQWSGRSGGGLFHNGRLIGTVIGYRDDARLSMYTTLDQCRAILSQPVAGAAKIAVTMWKAPFRCPPCDRSERNLVGDERFDLTVKTGPAPFMDADWLERNKLNGYPYFEVAGKVYYGYTTADGLAKLIESQQVPAVEIGPVGASINGKSVIESIFSWLTDGDEFAFRWQRRGGKDALVVGKAFTREDLLGTSGRIEATSNFTRLPINAIAFDYRFDGGKVFFKLDEIACEIPEDDSVSGPQAVGSPLLLAWSILSTIQTIYAVLSPTVDVYIGNEIAAKATYRAGKLDVDFGEAGPKVRLHWRFLFGLMRFEHSRQLSSIDITNDAVGVHFRNVSLWRDIVLEVW